MPSTINIKFNLIPIQVFLCFPYAFIFIVKDTFLGSFGTSIPKTKESLSEWGGTKLFSCKIFIFIPLFIKAGTGRFSDARTLKVLKITVGKPIAKIFPIKFLFRTIFFCLKCQDIPSITIF